MNRIIAHAGHEHDETDVTEVAETPQPEIQGVTREEFEEQHVTAAPGVTPMGYESGSIITPIIVGAGVVTVIGLAVFIVAMQSAAKKRKKK